jgi:hypothetical protein
MGINLAAQPLPGFAQWVAHNVSEQFFVCEKTLAVGSTEAMKMRTSNKNAVGP